MGLRLVSSTHSRILGMRSVADPRCEHKALIRHLKAKGASPLQQDAALARRSFIAVAPFFVLQVHTAIQRSARR